MGYGSYLLPAYCWKTTNRMMITIKEITYRQKQGKPMPWEPCCLKCYSDLCLSRESNNSENSASKIILLTLIEKITKNSSRFTCMLMDCLMLLHRLKSSSKKLLLEKWVYSRFLITSFSQKVVAQHWKDKSIHLQEK